MTYVAQIDTHEITVTPRFKHVTYEDVPQSEIAGRAIMKTIEAVEIRFAGQKNYSPVVPVDGFWRRDGHKVQTYAERWPDQYRAFLMGDDQIADGSPLELLKPFGVTPSQLSLCRALKIHSIEALHGMQGDAVRNLGMAGNHLREMARRYMNSLPGAAQDDEIAALRAEIAAMKAANVIPAVETPPDLIEPLVAAADDDTRKAELKAEIARVTGATPRGNPSVETLERMLAEALQA